MFPHTVGICWYISISFLTYVIMCFQEWHLIISKKPVLDISFYHGSQPHIYRIATSPFRVRTPHRFVATPSDIAGSYVSRPHVFCRKTGLFMGCSKCISNFKIIRKPIVVSCQNIQVLPPMKTLYDVNPSYDAHFHEISFHFLFGSANLAQYGSFCSDHPYMEEVSQPYQVFCWVFDFTSVPIH